MQAKTEEGFSEAKKYNLGFSFGVIEAVEMNENRASELHSTPTNPSCILYMHREK
jgi:hypothetical protein